MSAETKKSPPVDEIREGTVRLPIWERQGPKGSFFVAGEPEVSYEKDGQWHSGSSYGEFDLECLALAALEARKAIRKLRKATRPAADAGEEDDLD